jgi:hypothetical protein
MSGESGALGGGGCIAMKAMESASIAAAGD